MLKKIINYIKLKITLLSMSIGNVEKNMLGQNGDMDDSKFLKQEGVNDHNLMHQLLNAEVTQEVKTLRSRTYKVIKEANKYDAKITGYDNDNLPITELKTINYTKNLRKIQWYKPDDSFTGVICFNNDVIKSGYDTDHDFNDSIDLNTMSSESKLEYTFCIERKNITIHNLERYITKAHIHKSDHNEKYRVDIFVNRVPEMFNPRTRLFASYLKKQLKNWKRSDLFDINGCSFLSDRKTVGVAPSYYYEFTNAELFNVEEFEGKENSMIIIQYYMDAKDYGTDIFEKYDDPELNERYRKKEPKK